MALLLKHQLSIVLILQELLVEHANEGVLVIGNVLANFILCIPQLLHYCLDYFFIECEDLFDSRTACRVVIRHSSLRLRLVAVRLWLIMVVVTLEDLLGVAKKFLTILQPAISARRCNLCRVSLAFLPSSWLS